MEPAESRPAALPKFRRFAELAAVLARAVRARELEGAHALRVLRHQLRIMNTNSAMKVPQRSLGAQEVIDEYERTGATIPKNGSPDALHCDHLHPLSLEDLEQLVSVEDWLLAMPRLTEVVCVTAAENYRLISHEAAGITGWEKYNAADIVIRPVQAGS